MKNAVDYDILKELIHKMNLSASDKERIHWNRLKLELWNIADQLKDMGHSPQAESFSTGQLPSLSARLWQLVQEIPVIQK